MRHHPTFAPLQEKLWTPFNQLLAVLMGFGLLSLIARFVLGLGGSTHLSDTYAWGLWIVFDLVWIAIAAGAFATAGIIYVFQRKDLYPMGRAAVLMGFLSYSFVTVTLTRRSRTSIALLPTWPAGARSTRRCSRCRGVSACM